MARLNVLGALSDLGPQPVFIPLEESFFEHFLLDYWLKLVNALAPLPLILPPHQVACRQFKHAVEAPQLAIFADITIEILLERVLLLFGELLKDLLVDLDAVPEDRKDCVAFVRAQN